MYLDEIGHFSHFLLYVAIRIEINKMAVCLSVLGLHSDLCRWAVKQNKFTLLYLVGMVEMARITLMYVDEIRLLL